MNCICSVVKGKSVEISRIYFFGMCDIIKEICKQNDDDEKRRFHALRTAHERDDIQEHEKQLIEDAEEKDGLFRVAFSNKHRKKLKNTAERDERRDDACQGIGNAKLFGDHGKIRSCHENGNKIFERRFADIHQAASLIKCSIHNWLRLSK